MSNPSSAPVTREALKHRRACECLEPDPVMQADRKFYCGTCSFETGARPALLEPENRMPTPAPAGDPRPPQTPDLRALTFERFSAVNLERCESPTGFNHPLSSWSTSDWFTAIMGELGEAANVAKKLNRIRDGIPGNKESEQELLDKLRKELGDTFVYLDLLAQLHGFNIGAAAVEVFNAKSDEIGCPIRLDAALAQIPPAATPELGEREEIKALLDQYSICPPDAPLVDRVREALESLLTALCHAHMDVSPVASTPEQEQLRQLSLHELRLLRLRIEKEIVERGAVVDGRDV